MFNWTSNILHRSEYSQNGLMPTHSSSVMYKFLTTKLTKNENTWNLWAGIRWINYVKYSLHFTDFSPNAQLMRFCFYVYFEPIIIKISREENKIRAKIHLRL